MAKKRAGKSSVPVVPYRRRRFGKLEHVRRHGRGPRSKSPGGYKKRGRGS